MTDTFRMLLAAITQLRGWPRQAVSSAAPGGVKVGSLTCDVASGWGFVFGSSRRDLHCTFHGNANRPGEHYTGTISKFGVDIGYTDGGVLVWSNT